MSGARRVFVGLVPPPELCDDLCARFASALSPELAAHLRVYPARDVHLTLAFLGQTEAERVAALRERLQAELERMAALELELTHCGAFPSPSRAHALWAGVCSAPHGSRRLEELHAAVLRAVEAAGIALPARERERFQAHLTLARAPHGRDVALPRAIVELELRGSWLAREVYLFASNPDASRGPRYPRLERVPLRAPG